MEMIEKLEPVFEKCSDGVARQFPPRPYDMMYKINELVEAVNRMEKQIEKQKEQKHPNGCFTCDEYKKGYELRPSNQARQDPAQALQGRESRG